MRGFIVVLLVACVLGAFVWQTRDRLVHGGDAVTLEILIEPYHWTFMNHPRRVDDERDEWHHVAVLWYGPTVVSFLPHMAAQLVLPAARSQIWAHNLSSVLALALLSILYLVATSSGVPPWQAAVLTILTLSNPLLLYVLCFMAILPATALLPLACWAYQRRRLVITGLLLIFAAYSYRAGGLFVLLTFVAMRCDEDDYRQFNSVALVVLVLITVLQVVLQFAFALTVDVVGELEAGRMLDASEGLVGLLSAEILGRWALRFGLFVAWLLSTGGVLLWRPRRWRRLLLLLAFAGWTTAITSIESQVLLFMVCAAALLAIRELRDLDARRGRLALAAVGVGGLVVALALPVCRAPVPLSDLDGGQAFPEKLVRPVAYFARAGTLEADPHLTAAEELMRSVGPVFNCMVELHVAPLVSADICHDIVALGRNEPVGPGSNAGFVLLDTDPRARLLRRDYSEAQQALYLEAVDWLSTTHRVGLVSERDGLLLFRRGAASRADLARLERFRGEAFPRDPDDEPVQQD